MEYKFCITGRVKVFEKEPTTERQIDNREVKVVDYLWNLLNDKELLMEPFLEIDDITSVIRKDK